MHPDAANIPLALLAVFGSAKLLAELFERMRPPAIVGEILAGSQRGVATLVAFHSVVAPFLGWGILALRRVDPITAPRIE